MLVFFLIFLFVVIFVFLVFMVSSSSSACRVVSFLHFSEEPVTPHRTDLPHRVDEPRFGGLHGDLVVALLGLWHSFLGTVSVGV